MNANAREHESRTVWKIFFSDKQELAQKLNELIKMGFLFAGGPHGWPPEEVVANLSEKKLLKGSFKEVRWRGPGDWFIIER